jgi:hypothetical protein
MSRVEQQVNSRRKWEGALLGDLRKQYWLLSAPVTCLRRKASWSGGAVLVLSAEAFERVTASDQESKWQTSGSQTNLDLDLALSSSAKT